MIQNNINNVRDREAYNMKKIKKFNSIDQMHNTEDLKNLIIIGSNPRFEASILNHD